MSDVKEKLKEQIIKQLNLEGIKPSDIDSAAPLFGDGLGLDSIDALEIIVLLEKEYNIKLSDPQGARQIFYSIDTLSDFITANKK